MNTTAHSHVAAPRLERPRDDRMISGVSAGIARHLNIDPTLVRLAFIVAAIAGGVGFLAYIAALLLIPEEGSDVPLLRSIASPRGGRIAGIFLLVIGGVATLDAIAGDGVADDVFWTALTAAGGGYLLLRAQRDTPGVEGETTTTPGSSAPRSRVATSVVAGTMLLVAAGLSGLTAAGLDLSWQEATGIAIVGAGAALVAGSFFGAPPWLAGPPLVIAACVAALGATGAVFDGPIGDRAFHPATSHELPGTYRVAVGALKVDLRDLALPEGTTTVKVRVGVGEARVQVPADVALRIVGHAGTGEVRLPGGRSEGTDVDRRETIATPGRPVLVIDAGVGLGEVRVDRAGAR